MQDRISVNATVCSGRACIKGKRNSVYLIVKMLANGDTIEDILEDYPTITREYILACLAYAGQLAEEENVTAGERASRKRKGTMDSINLDAVLNKDGEISINGLPFKKGDRVKMTIRKEVATKKRIPLTGKRLLESGLVGMWEDRTDIGDSVEFARKLRENAQRRPG